MQPLELTAQNYNPQVVAVYGTLRKGKGNHSVLEDSVFLGTQTLRGRFEMRDLGPFPYAVKTDREDALLVVEVYLVQSHRVWGRLDRLEGFPRHYNRSKTPLPEPVPLPGAALPGKPLVARDAWVYHAHGAMDDLPLVESGDWNAPR